MEIQLSDGTKIPACIEVNNVKVYSIPCNAQEVGIKMKALGWPRRAVVDRLQLRLEFYLDAGGVFKDHNGDPFDVAEDFIESTLYRGGRSAYEKAKLEGDALAHPDYKWISDYPKKCVKGLKQTPSLIIQERLQAIDLGLAVPALGLAI